MHGSCKSNSLYHAEIIWSYIFNVSFVINILLRLWRYLVVSRKMQIDAKFITCPDSIDFSQTSIY